MNPRDLVQGMYMCLLLTCANVRVQFGQIVAANTTVVLEIIVRYKQMRVAAKVHNFVSH